MNRGSWGTFPCQRSGGPVAGASNPTHIPRVPTHVWRGLYYYNNLDKPLTRAISAFYNKRCSRYHYGILFIGGRWSI